MAFGQAAGPPASAKRIQELAELLEQHGFTSFREARHPFGLTQRQAGGKFTNSEIDDLMERLELEGDGSDGGSGGDVVSDTSESAVVAPEPARPRTAARSKGTAGPQASARAATARPTAARSTATRNTARGGAAMPPSGTSSTAGSSSVSERAARRALERQEEAAVTMSADVMATELTNRGWCCIPPPPDDAPLD